MVAVRNSSAKSLPVSVAAQKNGGGTCPTHLDGGWNDDHWLLGVVDGREDVTKLIFFALRYRHAPESVFDVKFAEEKGAIL